MSAQQTSFKCTEESVPPVLTSFLLRASESMAEYWGVGSVYHQSKVQRNASKLLILKLRNGRPGGNNRPRVTQMVSGRAGTRTQISFLPAEPGVFVLLTKIDPIFHLKLYPHPSTRDGSGFSSIKELTEVTKPLRA